METHDRAASFSKALEGVRHTDARVGLVPTMGALHAGHISLIDAALAANDSVAVTIFVNPLQFGPGEDFTRYPRTIEQDLEMLRAAGVQHVFAPPVAEMYPDGTLDTSVHVDVGEGLMEAAHRPGHFDGVATVVSKLFNIAGPCSAYFGEKDWQQLAVIRMMAHNLSFPVEIVGCPIIREPDGLAMSSRNRYLDANSRQVAVCLNESLLAGRNAFASGEYSPDALRQVVLARLSSAPNVDVHYVQVADDRLQEPKRAEVGNRLLVAATVGGARLIDNMELV